MKRVKYPKIGGQAVMEGVMMKSDKEYAVAVRKPDHEIEVKRTAYVDLTKRNPILGLPIIRGMVNFIESMKLGMKTLTYSASFYEEEDVKPTKMETAMQGVFKEKAESVFMGLTVCLAIVLAVGLFMLLPLFLAELLKGKVASLSLRGLIEGVIRIAIFISYIKAISMMKDVRRVFMYHGAEHKTINCVERGVPPTVENVKKQSKEHRRCGTSFLLIVMFVSVLFFMFIQLNNVWMRMGLRILLIPIIAGVAYEFIRWAGNHDGWLVRVLSRPGLWLQALTTKEPDDDMIEVAIASMEAVFDWKKYIEGRKDRRFRKRPSKRVGNAGSEKEGNVAIGVAAVPGSSAQATTALEAGGDVDVQTAVTLDGGVDAWNAVASDEDEGVDAWNAVASDEGVDAWNAVALDGDEDRVARDVATMPDEEESAAVAATSVATDDVLAFTYLDADDDEEDDEILKALDRFFDAPKAEDKDVEKIETGAGRTGSESSNASNTRGSGNGSKGSQTKGKSRKRARG